MKPCNSQQIESESAESFILRSFARTSGLKRLFSGVDLRVNNKAFLKCIRTHPTTMEDRKTSKARFRDRLRQIPRTKRRAFFMAAVVVIASMTAAIWILERSDRGLVFTAFADKDAYSSEEWIGASVRFKNYGFDSVHLTFGSSAMASFSVYTSEGVPVCSILIDSLQVITEVTIKPGQSKEYGIRWNQLAYGTGTGFGEPVPSGTYYIVAGTCSWEFHATAFTSPFTISG